MQKIDSINKVPIIEVDGKEEEDMELTVRNHWNWSDRVVLEFGDFKITVDAFCLKRAIDNALNAHA